MERREQLIIHTTQGLEQKKQHWTTNWSVIKPLDLIIGLSQTQIYSSNKVLTCYTSYILCRQIAILACPGLSLPS